MSAAQRGLAGKAPQLIAVPARRGPRLVLFGRELPLGQLIGQGLVVGLGLLFLLFGFC